MRNNGRKAWVLLLVLLAGVLIGGVAWLLLQSAWPAAASVKDLVIGTSSPWSLNLSLIDLSLGIKLHINPGSALGLIIGLVVYFWKR